MKAPVLIQCLVRGLALCAAHLAFGQTGLPTSQPKLLTIVREEVKPGRAADHANHEAGWPAAFEKAMSPDYYLAMTSLTGPSEAWYVIPQAGVPRRRVRQERDGHPGGGPS